jgi:hypothetical protein
MKRPVLVISAAVAAVVLVAAVAQAKPPSPPKPQTGAWKFSDADGGLSLVAGKGKDRDKIFPRDQLPQR